MSLLAAVTRLSVALEAAGACRIVHLHGPAGALDPPPPPVVPEALRRALADGEVRVIAAIAIDPGGSLRGHRTAFPKAFPAPLPDSTGG